MSAAKVLKCVFTCDGEEGERKRKRWCGRVEVQNFNWELKCMR